MAQGQSYLPYPRTEKQKEASRKNAIKAREAKKLKEQQLRGRRA